MGRKVSYGDEDDDADIKALIEASKEQPKTKEYTPKEIKYVSGPEELDNKQEEEIPKPIQSVDNSLERQRLKAHAYDLIAFIEIARSRIGEAQEKLIETNKKLEELKSN